MILEQKPARKQGAPNRCCHRTIPTVSASSLTTIAWWPMPACSCQPPSPGTWACGNSSTITLTSAALPGHQHLAGAGGNGQQRVIAAGAGIAVMARSLLGQSIGLADGRVQVDGQGRVAGSGPSGPGPGQQLAAHAVELTDIAPPEAAQEGAQGGGSLSRETEHAGGPAGAQRVGVVDAISAG